MSDTAIPKCWIKTKLSEICMLNPRVKLDDDLDVGFMPMSDVPKDYFGKTSYEVRKWVKVKKGYTQFKNNDTLFAKITPCFENSKATVVSGFPNGWGAGSTEYHVLRPVADLIDTRLLYALVKTKDFLFNGTANMAGSVGHRRVPKDFIENHPFSLMPLAEQKQIAAKLDELLAQVDTIKNRLDAIPSILKRFRQSVLAAAVSGRLTEVWRENIDGQFKLSGQQVINNDDEAKAVIVEKYPELKKKKSSLQCDINTDYIFEIPKSWKFTSWGNLSEWITYGFTKPMPKSSKGVKLITAKDVKNFSLNIEGANLTTAVAYESLSEKDRPKCGDLLITKDGTIGRPVLVRTKEPFCINQSVAVCWLRSTRMNKDYLEILANSDFTQSFVQDKSQGMAIQHLSIIDFAKCPVPVPSIEEQDEIVRSVHQLFGFADQIEKQVNSAQTRVNNLTQSVLAKAFRGELTAEWREQNPEQISGENSAEALLEKIRKEREFLKPAKKIRRKMTA